MIGHLVPEKTLGLTTTPIGSLGTRVLLNR